MRPPRSVATCSTLTAQSSLRARTILRRGGRFDVTKDGREVTVMYPEKRRYFVQNQTMTEAAISPGLLRDLYVSLGEPLEGGAWSVRLYHKPFIDWIWGGCLVMALGGVLAVSDRRYRLAWRRKEAAVPATAQMARPTVS